MGIHTIYICNCGSEFSEDPVLVMSMFCLHKEYQEAVYLVTLSSKLQCLNLRGNESLVSQSASVLQSVSDLCRLWSRRDLWRCRDSHGTWHSENYSPPVRSCQLLSVPVSHSLLWAYVADVAYAAAVAPVSHGSGLSFILFQSAQLLGLLRVDHEADEKGIDAIEHAQILGPLSPLGHGLTLFYHIVWYCHAQDELHVQKYSGKVYMSIYRVHLSVHIGHSRGLGNGSSLKVLLKHIQHVLLPTASTSSSFTCWYSHVVPMHVNEACTHFHKLTFGVCELQCVTAHNLSACTHCNLKNYREILFKKRFNQLFPVFPK